VPSALCSGEDGLALFQHPPPSSIEQEPRAWVNVMTVDQVELRDSFLSCFNPLGWVAKDSIKVAWI
jgi:hypothetical protein